MHMVIILCITWDKSSWAMTMSEPSLPIEVTLDDLPGMPDHSEH